MAAFLGISLWVALATVVPGLVTISVLFCAFAVADPAILDPAKRTLTLPSDWLVTGVVTTVMVLTQALGILLEELIVKRQLFPGCEKLEVPKAFGSDEKVVINAYKQYDGVYILLAQLSEHEDAQGHLKRTAAQFFLTNNSLVSFSAGIIVTLILAAGGGDRSGYLYAYAFGLLVCLLVSYWVAVLRFRVMAKSIWATCIEREKKKTGNSTG